MTDEILELLGDDGRELLSFELTGIPSEMLTLPGPDFLERSFLGSDRNLRVLRSLQSIYDHGRLGGTGYLSILPVDQGVEHTAGSSFSPNPIYFDPEYILELATEGGCNAVASTFGVLGAVARRWAHRIPFIVKLNHNELLTYPKKYDQIMFASVDQAYDMGAVAVGATVYFGSEESDRQLMEVAEAFAHAHELGMATVLWCYTRNEAFAKGGVDYHTSADLTGQANHLGVTVQADLVKQKLPTVNGGFEAVGFGRPTPGCTATWCRSTPSPGSAGRSRTATWAASASSTPAAPRRARTTSPRRCGPPCATSAAAAPASSRGAKPSSARWTRAYGSST